MSGVFKRNGSDKYYFWYKDKFGKWRKRASSFTNRKSAEFEQQEFQRSILNQKYGYLEIKGISFDKFAEEYRDKVSVRKKSFKSDLSRQKILCNYFKGSLLYEIKAKDIDEYIQSRLGCISARKRPVSRTSINRELELLKAMLNKAIEWEYLETNPARKIKKFREENRDRIISASEVNKLIRLAKEPLRSFILLAVHTGMRRGEILKLRWEDVHLDEKYLFIKHTKTYCSRKIPINNAIVSLLNKLREKVPTNEYVFANPKTNRPYVEISSSWGTLLKKANIANLTFHDLRGIFATYFHSQDHDLLALQRMLGHQSIQTTLRYAQPLWASMQKSVGELGSRFGNSSNTGILAELFFEEKDA